MKLILYCTGWYSRFFSYRWTDRYQNPPWFVPLWVLAHTGLFQPYRRKLDVSANKSNRYQKKKKKYKKTQKSSVFVITATHHHVAGHPMSPATSILSIAVSPPALASSSSPLHFFILCFSSTFQLLYSLVFLVLNTWYILFWTLESHSHVNILKSLNESSFQNFQTYLQAPLCSSFNFCTCLPKKKKTFEYWFLFLLFFHYCI